MFKSSFPVSIAVVIILLFSANSAFSQCGADGTQPCPKATPKKTTTTKKTTTKPTTKPTVTKPTTTNKTQTKTVTKTTTKQGCTKADNFNNKDAPGNSTVTINGVKFEFVGIPSGSFCMGSNDGEADEKPVHRVNLTRAFSMGKYEVTQVPWQAVMGNNPSEFKSCGGNCPVVNISWEDVQDFLRKLNKIGEGTYRLPTEAEWEYAARAGSTTKYSYGNGESSLENYAWYNANSGDKTHEVGTKQANDWGLYDMHGNVWEWVSDWYGSYTSGAVTDPTGATSGSARVLRGGSYGVVAVALRSAYRSRVSPSFGASSWGFRVVRI